MGKKDRSGRGRLMWNIGGMPQVKAGSLQAIIVFGNCAKAEVWHGVEVGRG